MFLLLVESDTGYPRIFVEFINLCSNTLFYYSSHFNSYVCLSQKKFSCSLFNIFLIILFFKIFRVFLGTDKKKIIERLKYEVLALLTAQEDDVATTLLMLPFAFQDFEVLK